ncbi:putative neprosin [Helianthus anomalus]
MQILLGTSMIEWGGEVVNLEPLGQHNGQRAILEDTFGKSSYFRKIQVVDKENNLKSPKDIGTFIEQSNCFYDVYTG